MTEPTIEHVIRNLDRRLDEVLQILPTLATKEQVREEVREQVKNLATKEELRGLATKNDLLGLATKEELQALATRQELALTAIRDDQLSLASREELHATRDTLRQEIRDEGARSRRHMDIVAEDLKSQLRLVTESHLMLEARARLHHDGTAERLDAVETDVALLKLRHAGTDRS